MPLRIRALSLEITNGSVPNRVRVSSGFNSAVLDLAPGEVRIVELKPARGVPYKPAQFPTNFVSPFSASTTAGFAPFLEDPKGNSDSRYLGAMVRIVPVYFNP